MSTLLKKPYSVLEKSRSASMSDKDFEVYTRVEQKFTPKALARLTNTLGEYRSNAEKMTPLDVMKEKHCSTRLGKFLRADGQGRPAARWDAHHIISGEHRQAEQSRLLLAEILVRIDDPDNGA
jgi:hypothetical protein